MEEIIDVTLKPICNEMTPHDTMYELISVSQGWDYPNRPMVIKEKDALHVNGHAISFVCHYINKAENLQQTLNYTEVIQNIVVAAEKIF